MTAKRPTLRDVADRAGLSIASASRALNGRPHVSPAVLARVREAADGLGFVPHAGARHLTLRRTRTIGVILPDLFGEFFSELIRGIDHAAHRHEQQLLLSTLHGATSRVATVAGAMSGRVDGLLVMAPECDPDALARDLPAALPTVLLNTTLPGRSSIMVDNRAGAAAATEHLIAGGRRRLAFVAGPLANSDVVARLEGFRTVMAERVGEADPLVLPGDFSEESGSLAAGALLARRGAIDGVVCANDMMAIGCLLALRAGGVAVPDEIAVIGFDDVPAARYLSPTLSSVHIGIGRMGTLAVERLLESINVPDAEPRQDTLHPDLVLRQSTPLTPTHPRLHQAARTKEVPC